MFEAQVLMMLAGVVGAAATVVSALPVGPTRPERPAARRGTASRRSEEAA